jgi:hypothetical protein
MTVTKEWLCDEIIWLKELEIEAIKRVTKAYDTLAEAQAEADFASDNLEDIKIRVKQWQFKLLESDE